MKESNTKNFIILGLIIGVFILLAVFFVIITDKQVNTDLADEIACEELLPKVEKRLFEVRDVPYEVDYAYGDVSEIEMHYSPALRKCIYSYREQNFTWQEGGIKYETNMQARIVDYETDEQLFNTIVRLRHGGEDIEAYRRFESELLKYTQL